jgi:anti-sigma factor RsiW
VLTDEPLAPDCRRLRDSASDYLDGYISDQNRARFEEHLDACQACADFFDEFQMTVGLLSELREGAVSEQEESSAIRVYDEYFPEPEMSGEITDWTSIKRTWWTLARLPHEQRRLAIRESSEFLEPLLCDWLIARAKQVSSVNPNRAVPLADAAVEIARQRRSRFGDSRRLILALQALAGCLVVLREFVRASHILGELEVLCEASDAAFDERAGYLGTKGLYYSQIGQFQESELYLAQALELRRRYGSRKTVVCEIVNLAGTRLSAGDPHGALSLYREAERMLTLEDDPPRLQFAVFSSLVLALCQVHQPNEARRVLPRVRDLAATVGGWYSRIYTEWLEGTLFLSEGEYEAAGRIFERVRSEFCVRRHVVWCVEASLDLAQVHLQRNQIRKLRELASDLLCKVEEMDADVRTRTAVLSFVEAVRQRSLSRQVLNSIAVLLQSARLSHRL